MVRHPSEFREDDREGSPTGYGSRPGRAKDAEVYKGLCANCAKRETCLLPESEGGVWHCEKYTEES